MSENPPTTEVTLADQKNPSASGMLLDRFDEAWHKGQRPNLEDYLPGPGHPHRRQILSDLLHMDIEHHCKSNQPIPGEAGPERIPEQAGGIRDEVTRIKPKLPIRVEAYLERFPELHQDRALLVDLLAWEFELRRREEPDLETQEYTSRFPHLADDLRARLEGSGVLTLVPPLPMSEALTTGTKPGEAHAPPVMPDFDIESELGRGGMGVVYKARQIRLNRMVALKMILAGSHAGAEERLRFLAEAEVIASIDCPGIVKVYEFGTHEGALWFALEYCSGGSLHKKLGGTPLPVLEAAALLEQVARGVQAAHDKGVLHRDLKPGNILLDAQGLPRVTDFGLARRLEGDSGLTQTGAVMGTPSYMPPEQAQGRKDLGRAVDIYSLGAILYECLTGRPPFKATNMYDTILQVIEDEPVPPHLLIPGVPRDLETITLKCLQKEPEKRYPSASAMADELRRFLTGEPIHARPVSFVERSLKWMRRRPALATLAAAVVLAVVGAGVGGLFFGLYKEQQLAVFRKQSETREEIDRLLLVGQSSGMAGRRDLEGNQEEADKHLAEGERALDQALTLARREGSDEDLLDRIEEQLDLVRKDRDELERRRQMQPRVAKLRKVRNDILFHEINPTNRDRDKSRDQVRKLAVDALKEFGVSPDHSPEESVRSLEIEGKRLASAAEGKQVAQWCYEMLLAWAEAEASPKEKGDREAAKKALRLLDIADALARPHGLITPRAYHVRRARYLERSGDKKAAKQSRNLAEKQRPSTALDHFLAALEQYKQGQSALAAGACSLALRQQADHFWAQYLQSLCQVKLQRWVEAKAGLTACLVLRPDFIWARLTRGAVHAEWGAFLEKGKDREGAKSEFEAAEADFALALKQACDPKSGDPLAHYVALTNRSVLWLRQQLWKKAVTDLRDAIKLRPKDARAHVNLAEACRLRQDFKGALDALTRAVKCRPEDGQLYHTRSRIHSSLKDRPSARADLERAIKRLSEEGNQQLLASCYVELGELKKVSGQAREALSDFEAALAVQKNYPYAHRQRAEALLKLGDYRAAGKALDAYLATGKPAAKDYLARGLIHSQLLEHTLAVESYSAALLWDKKNADALSQRGWSYLQMNVPRMALADFESALKIRPAHASTLSGRGQARVMLGAVPEAVLDGEKALKLAPDGHQELMVACIYARAAGLMALTQRSGGRGRVRADSPYEERAADLVCKAVLRVKGKERAAYWQQHVQTEPALAPIRRHPRVLRLISMLSDK